MKPNEQAERSLQSDGVVPKLCGSDTELGNFLTGPGLDGERLQNTADEASRALLREFHGFSRNVYCTSRIADDDRDSRDDRDRRRYRQHAQDWGRKFLPSNGGCVYIDLSHLEICTPECRDAFTHMAAFHAMLRLTAKAMHRASESLSSGRRIRVLANNTDGVNSWGSHTNFLLTRDAYEKIFSRKLHYLLLLASCQVSSIVLTGAGAVGVADGRADYRISARGDFYKCLVGPQTTFKRPLVNCRDEPLTGSSSGDSSGLARLHVIFFDTTLCPVATVLKVGMMQVLLSMVEQDQVPAWLILDDPLEALARWSHDPSLQAKARLMSGVDCAILDHAQAVFDAALKFVQRGRAEGLVPQVGRIMTLWGETLDLLRRRDFPALSARCDWIAKHALLQRALRERNLNWSSPQLRLLDQLYSSIDDDGLYRALERAGAIEQLCPPEDIDRLTHEPPNDTRAWLRAQVMRRAPGSVDDVDWDHIDLRPPDESESHWVLPRTLTLDMANPLLFTRDRCLETIKRAPSFMDALTALGLRRQNEWTVCSMPAAHGTATEFQSRHN